MAPPRGIIVAFVTVGLRSQVPQSWGWELHGGAAGEVTRRSEVAFRRAEDAWKAARAALAEHEGRQSERPAGAQTA